MFSTAKMLVLSLALLCLLPCLNAGAEDAAGAAGAQGQPLSEKQQSIVLISAYTATGELDKLKTSLAQGLDAGLSVSETREILVQLYAYTGFPRSLNAIHTLMALLDERKKDGIKDDPGREPAPMPKDLDRNRYGAETRARLAGQGTVPPAAGYQLFAPAVDDFLKEHLFADIFYRDNLDWQSRELATVSALAAMTGTAGQQRFHINAAMNMDLKEDQLRALLGLIEKAAGRERAEVSLKVLEAVLAARGK